MIWWPPQPPTAADIATSNPTSASTMTMMLATMTTTMTLYFLLRYSCPPQLDNCHYNQCFTNFSAIAIAIAAFNNEKSSMFLNRGGDIRAIKSSLFLIGKPCLPLAEPAQTMASVVLYKMRVPLSCNVLYLFEQSSDVMSGTKATLRMSGKSRPFSNNLLQPEMSTFSPTWRSGG